MLLWYISDFLEEKSAYWNLALYKQLQLKMVKLQSTHTIPPTEASLTSRNIFAHAQIVYLLVTLLGLLFTCIQ